MYENQDATFLSCLLFFSVCRHQAGWFPFNLENELHLPGDRVNQDDVEGEQNHDLQEMVAAFFIHLNFTKNSNPGLNKH